MLAEVVGGLGFQSLHLKRNSEIALGRAVRFKTLEDGWVFAQQDTAPQLGVKGILFEQDCFGPLSGHRRKSVAVFVVCDVQYRNQVVDADGKLVNHICNSVCPFVEQPIGQMIATVVPSEKVEQW